MNTNLDDFYEGKPGIYLNVPVKDYIAFPAVSRGDLAIIVEKSPAHLKAERENNEVKNTVSTSLGSAVHCKLLEPEEFDKRFVQEPYKLDKRKSKDKEIYQLLCNSYDPANILSPEDWVHAEKMRESVENNYHWKELKDYPWYHEVTLLWQDQQFGFLCKGRPDVIVDLEDEIIIPDIKTSRDVRAFQFGRDIYFFSNYLQAQHYKEGAIALNLSFTQWIFFAVENSPPYCCIPYAMDDYSWSVAEDDLYYAKYLYARAVRTKNWHGYEGKIRYITIPQYADGRERLFEID